MSYCLLGFFAAREFNLLNCSDPFLGDELYTQMGFFVQSILADRYIHSREI